MLDLVRVGVGRHVRPMRFGGAGRQDHRPLLRDGCRDLHLRHVAHAVFHRRSVQFVSRRNEEFDSHPGHDIKWHPISRSLCVRGTYR